MELEVNNLSLYHTLECGQAFRWDKLHDGSYFGIVGKNAFLIYQKRERLEIISTIEDSINWAKIYFALDIDLERILRKIDTDEYIHTAIKSCSGLRILRQEPWETLASFILSSNNSIQNIKRMIKTLSQRLGSKIELNGHQGYSFPSPYSIVKNKGVVNTCRLGFRRDYLIETAEMITNGDIDLEGLRELPYKSLREKLFKLKGVGPKVADCVALFAFEKSESFPVDVWIKRILQKLYFSNKVVNDKKLYSFARKHFGRYCGYAQEYLYCYYRLKIPQEITSQKVGQEPKR